MSLRITERETEGILILSLAGRLVLGSEAALLQDTISALPPESNRLILDLKEVSFIDSSGLGVLVAAHSQVFKSGGAVKILHASKKHIELLVLTKLTTIFQLYDDENEAIDSFFPDRERTRFDILEFVKRRESGEPEPIS